MNVICGQMPWSYPDTFEAKPLYQPACADAWKVDIELKKQFAIALATNKDNPFKAGCEVFGKETNKALYASVHWVNDEVVTEAKDEYTEVTTVPKLLLDKDQLAARLLEFSEEKIEYNGNLCYAAEAKDRLSALKLYSDVMGFTGKTDIHNTNNFTKNFMEIKFVEPEKKEIKTIEHAPIQQEENILENSPIKLKLVG